MEAFGMGVAIIYLIFYVLLIVLAIAVGVAAYILTSLSLYTIAKRRGLDKPWAAWIPIGDAWIIGCISDQYRYFTHTDYSERGRDLLKHGVGLAISYVVFFFFYFVYLVFMILSSTEAPAAIGASSLLMLGLCMLASIGVMIFFMVRYYIRYYKALYDVYQSCNPQLPLLFLLLSIFVSYAMPVCLMICRNKDDGMPVAEPDPGEM